MRQARIWLGAALTWSQANLIDGHYDESFPGFADFGLTIDGAFALAATGDQDATLEDIVTFLDHNGKDPSGSTVNDWTGIGTPYASGGSLGKEALLAEIVGANPRHFSGHDLIAALDALVCARPLDRQRRQLRRAPATTRTPARFSPGARHHGPAARGPGDARRPRRSPTWRACSTRRRLPEPHPGQRRQRRRQHRDGGHGARARAGRRRGGGRRSGDRLDRRPAGEGRRLPRSGRRLGQLGRARHPGPDPASRRAPGADRAAVAFLAGEQNTDGGFNAAAGGQPDSDLRASTQAVSGAVGTSFGDAAPRPERHRRRRRTRPAHASRSEATVHGDPYAPAAGTEPAAAAPSGPAPADRPIRPATTAGHAAPSRSPSAPAATSADPGRPRRDRAPRVRRRQSRHSVAADLWWRSSPWRSSRPWSSPCC